MLFKATSCGTLDLVAPIQVLGQPEHIPAEAKVMIDARNCPICHSSGTEVHYLRRSGTDSHHVKTAAVTLQVEQQICLEKLAAVFSGSSTLLCFCFHW